MVLKLRLQGETLWHRLVLTHPADTRGLAPLHDAIRRKLAAFAEADASGVLLGFSPSELRRAKVARVTLLPDVLIGEDGDVGTLKAGDALEVQLKV